jgi:GNAT superfamily N-acetyltransferase
MQIIIVEQESSWKLFHQVPHLVYKNDPNWIAPLESDIRNIFDPQKNPSWKEGAGRCFVLLDEKGRPSGRIAAFIDHAANRLQQHPIGGIGFFECVDRAEFAHELFARAEAYLLDLGAKIAEGPVNFGEREKFWGLLVRGFAPPLYQENYHPAYYRRFFLQAGYQPYEQILTYAGFSKNIPFERFASIAERQKARYPLYVQSMDYDNLDKFASDFAEVYNASFAVFEHFHPVSPDLIRNMMLQARPIADTQIAAIAYHDKHPAGFIALYPDINPLLRHSKGKLNWWTVPVFLLKKRFTKTYDAKGLGFGIHPDFQSKGIFAVLMDFLCSKRNVRRYPRMYLAGIRAHNQAIRSIYEKMDVQVDRVHISLRKALSPGITITPNPFTEPY